MEQLTLAIQQSGDNSFGCLTDAGGKLLSSAFNRDSKMVQAHLLDYAKRFGRVSLSEENELTEIMVSLFNGNNGTGSAKLNTQYVSGFQQQVYNVLDKIPRGKVTTYGLISKLLNSAPRAVGGAVGSNPWPLFIPCQRVVNFDLTVGNYGMCGTLSRGGTLIKRAILEREAVPIINGHVARVAVWDPSRK